MIRYKLYGIIVLFIFSLPKLSTSHQWESPKSQKEKAFASGFTYPTFYPVKKKHKKKKKTGITVAASVYYPVVAQTDSTPNITADGSYINTKRARKHRWVALSRNLLKKWGGAFSYGDSLRVKGISSELDGIYVVRDTMKRKLRNRIDILIGPEDNIMGHWNNVQIYRLN